MILKKVLKKLQMSQDVEMKAYQMVEEMLTEREIEEVAPTDCSDHPMKNNPVCFCEFDYDLGECNCDCDSQQRIRKKELFL